MPTGCYVVARAPFFLRVCVGWRQVVGSLGALGGLTRLLELDLNYTHVDGELASLAVLADLAVLSLNRSRRRGTPFSCCWKSLG